MDTNYMYLFVRQDLTLAQQIVQMSHATFEVGRLHDITSPHFVLIGVKHYDALMDVSDWLSDSKVAHHMFYEPDITQHTAIATRPVSGNERDVFARFKLLRH